MAKLRLGEMRMCAADRERWSTPEWILIDPAVIYDAPSSKLEKWEAEMNFSFVQLLEVEVPAYTARSTRALLWIALKQIDIRPPWKDFDPLVMNVEARSLPTEAAEADPTPAETSTSQTSSPSSPEPDAAESQISSPS